MTQGETVRVATDEMVEAAWVTYHGGRPAKMHDYTQMARALDAALAAAPSSVPELARPVPSMREEIIRAYLTGRSDAGDIRLATTDAEEYADASPVVVAAAPSSTPQDDADRDAAASWRALVPAIEDVVAAGEDDDARSQAEADLVEAALVELDRPPAPSSTPEGEVPDRFRVVVRTNGAGGWEAEVYDLADHGPDLPYAQVTGPNLVGVLDQALHYVLMAEDPPPFSSERPPSPPVRFIVAAPPVPVSEDEPASPVAPEDITDAMVAAIPDALQATLIAVLAFYGDSSMYEEAEENPGEVVGPRIFEDEGERAHALLLALDRDVSDLRRPVSSTEGEADAVVREIASHFLPGDERRTYGDTTTTLDRIRDLARRYVEAHDGI